jgi:gliding motility-associated-like protein
MGWEYSTEGSQTWNSIPNNTSTQRFDNLNITTSYRAILSSESCGARYSDTAQVSVIQPFKMKIPPDTKLCIADKITLRAANASSYIWSPSLDLDRADVANPIASPATTTTYTVIGKDAFGCFTDTGKVTISVGKPSTLFIGNDTTIMAGTTINLSARVGNAPAIKYSWKAIADLDCRGCVETKATIKKDECISCTITNTYGCQSTDTICIKTFCKSAQAFIPNAFSPDGDGVNDKLYVMGTGIKLVKSFRIFNRWGQLVFEKINFNTNDPANGWDGTVKGIPAPPEIYVYICEVICESDIPYTYTGNVGIIK